VPGKPVKVMFTDYYRSFDITKVEHMFEWKMLSKLCQPELSHNPDILFYSCFGDKYLQYDCKRVFVTPENIRPNLRECDWAFSYDYPVTERNYRLPLYRRWHKYNEVFLPRDLNTIATQNRKFCSFMVSNRSAHERIDFFKKLSFYKHVDSGGKHLNNIDGPIQGGPLEKMNWLRGYKFNITFENSSYPGYTTEKLLEALVSGTVPIYWGNPLVGLDFNPKAFINCHDFNSFDEVIEYVKEVDQNDELYKELLSQPILPGGKETEFCCEENILARFEEIVNSNKVFISQPRKRIQKIFRPAQKKMKRRINKINYRISELTKAAKRRLGKIFHLHKMLFV